MKQFNKWRFRTTVVALFTVCLLGGVVLAATTAGGSSDPLVSYSYFTETILPSLLTDVEEEALDVADDLSADFDIKIADYTAEMETLAAQTVAQGGGNTSTGDGAYSVITLSPGETLSLNAGAEVMLRIGSATISGGTPALINATSGTELADGGALTTNHLYLCTINGRTLTAGTSTTWILLRQ